MKFFKKQSIHERKIGDKSLVLTADGNIDIDLGTTKNVNITGDLRVSGDTTGPKTTDVLYVSQDGSDTNDGRSEGKFGAKRTIKSAVEAAVEGTTIIVAPGDYYEENPIVLPDFVTVTGQGELRNTRVWPKNNTQTIFYVGNGCYLYQLTFRGLRAPGFCAEIRPGTLCTTSPYVQNCTNMNGPWLNDGTEFIPFETVQIEGIEPSARPLMLEDYPDLPFDKQVNNYGGGGGMYVDGDQYDPASLVFSFVADAFTQIAQGGIGFWIDNFGYTQIVSCFTVFCSTGFKTTNGGYLSISNSVSDFGLEGCIADGFYPVAYTTATPIEDYYSTVASVTITSPGVGYSSNPTVVFEAPDGPGGVTATAEGTVDLTTGQLAGVTMLTNGSGYTQVPQVTFVGGGATIPAEGRVNLSTNTVVTIQSLRDKPGTGSVIKFDGDDTYYYITGSNIIQSPFFYDEQVCRRDIRRIVDAVTADAVLGTTYQSVQAGLSYLRSTSNKVVQDQLAPTIYGINAARDQMTAATSDVVMRQEIVDRFKIITDIIESKVNTTAPSIGTTLNDLSSIDAGIISAKDNIIENKEFLIKELSAYINDQFTELSYPQAEYEDNLVLFINGMSSYAALGSNHIVKRIAQEWETRPRHEQLYVSSFKYLQGLFSGLSEVALSADARDRVNEAFNLLVNIVDDGDSSAIVSTFPDHDGLEVNRGDARDQLIANYDLLVQEFVSYIAYDNPEWSFDSAAFEEQFSDILDGLIFDITYGGDSASVQEVKYYYAKLNPENISEVRQQTMRDAFARMRLVISRVVRGLSTSLTSGNTETQDFTSGNATQSEADKLDALLFNYEDAIAELTLTRLPTTSTYPSIADEATIRQDAANVILQNRDTFIGDAIEYNLTNNPDLTYNVEKCKRDVGLILDALYIDAQIGTNHNSITAGLAYNRANTYNLQSGQKPATILAMREAKRLMVNATVANNDFSVRVGTLFDDILNIIEFDQLPSEGTEYPDPGPASNELLYALDNIIANRAFMTKEVTAYIADTYFVYNKAKCERDTGYIIDAATYDAALGTNYNAVVNGLAYARANANVVTGDQLTETVGAITFAKGEASTAASSDLTTQGLVESAFNEVIDILQNGEGNADPITYTNPTGTSTELANTKAQLQNNRDFLVAEAVAWVENNFENFTYDRATCERDIQLIMDALALDAALGTNYNAVTAGNAYLRANASNVQNSQLIQTIGAITELGQQLKKLGLSNTAEIRVLKGVDIILDILKGPSYNQLLCRRDLDYITDSVGWDIATGSNYNAVTAGLSYLRAPSAYVLSDQFDQTTDAIRYAKSLIATSYVNTDATAVSRSNAAFDEILDIIDGGVYDKDVCSRDTQNIIDSVGWDAILGTNYNAVTTGLSYQRAPASYVLSDQFQQTVAAIEYLNELALAEVAGNTTVTNRVNSAFAEILDIINNGTGNADALTWTDPGEGYEEETNSRTLLQLNRTLISTEVTSWINTNYPSLTYDQATCERDIGYIVDAISFDIQYGGNFATRRAADAYYTGAVSVLPAAQRAPTAAAFNQLATILSQIVVGTYSGQTLNAGLVGSATEVARVDALAQIIEDVITAGTVNGLPDLVKPNTGWVASTTLNSTNNFRYNNIELIENVIAYIDDNIASNADTITWTDPGVDVNKRYAREQLQINRDFIASELTTWINNNYPTLDYNEQRCARDVKYIVDAISFDVQYGGNFATRRVADAYFSYAVSVLPEDQRTQTAAAYVQLATILSQIVTETYPLQDTSGTAASATEATEVSDLVGIIEDVITANSTAGIPTLVEPSTTWVAAGTESARTNLISNKATVINSVITEINNNLTNAPDIEYPTPTTLPYTYSIEAKDQLVANRQFLIDETTAWIAVNYPALVYDVDRCERDVGYIVDALAHDITYGGNSATRIAAEAYFVGAVSQLGAGEATATAAAYAHLATVIDDVVQEIAVTPSAGNTTPQDTSGEPASATEGTQLDALMQIIEDVITAGNTTGLPAQQLPSVAWAASEIQASYNTIKASKEAVATNISIFIANNYQDFQYDQAKCERDVGIMINAAAIDAALGTNYNAVTAGLAYQRANASLAIGDQNLQTVLSIKFVRDSVAALTLSSQTINRTNAAFNEILDIIENGVVSTDTSADALTFPVPTGATANVQNAHNELQNNKAFLIAEVTAWLAANYPALTYDVAKCERDVGYLIDAFSYDILYGGNSASRQAADAYFVGATSQLGSGSEVAASIDVYTQLKAWISDVVQNIAIGSPQQGVVTQNTTGPGASATEATTVTGLLDITIDVLTAGNTTGLPAEILPDITWQTTAVQDDYATIIANRSAITIDTIAYITETFTKTFVFDGIKCGRDVGYIVDALIYDLLYGGNSATYDAANAYWVGATTQVAGQQYETSLALGYVQELLEDIILDQTAANTQQGVETQDTTAGAGTITEVLSAQALIQIIRNVIEFGIDNLPTRNVPSYSWATSQVQTAVDALQAAKATIVADTIDYIGTTYNGFSYDIDLCERDAGYVVDAVAHDTLYGGNYATTTATYAYFLGTAQYLPSDQIAPTVAAYNRLKTIMSDIIQGVAVTPSSTNTETQTFTGSYGTSVEAGITTDLFDDILILAINNQSLVGTPAQVLPDFSWLSEATRLIAADLLASKVTVQNGVIDYIDQNIIGFEYNSAKCERDTGYIIDATVFDMMYGGNKWTRRAAEAYYNGAILGAAKVGNTDQVDITAYSYYYLADIIEKVANNDVVTKSYGNLTSQKLTTPDTTETAASLANTLVRRIGQAVFEESLSGWSEIGPDLSLGNGSFLTEREVILAAEDDIVDNAIANLNLQFGGTAEVTIYPGVISVTSDTQAGLYNVSTISTSGHAFEYVGAGITYNALPFFGGTAVPEKEIQEFNQGKVFAGGTVDQIGNFRVGNFFAVNALSGAITLNANEIDLSGLTSVGPFIRDGIPVGVELKEVSDNTNLISSIGTQDFNTAPTQRAVSVYVENRYLNKLTGGTVTGDIVLDGNFDVNGDVIATDVAGTFNLLNTTATTIEAFGDATAINMGSDTGLFTIRPDLLVEGSLTVNGDIIFTGDVSLNIPDETQQAYSISTEGSLDYISINTRTDEERITFGIRPTFLVENATESTSVATGAVVIDGGVGIAKSLFVGADFTADGSVVLGDDRAVDTLDINAATDIDIPDNGLNVFRVHENITDYIVVNTTDAAESVTIGATPNLIVLNSDDATDNATGAIQSTGGISSLVNIHAGQDLVADRDVIADRDIQVNGTNITTDETATFNVFNTNATTINAFGDATAVNIGAATGTITFNNDYFVFDSVEAIQIPVGTSLDRPTAVTGQIRFNTTTLVFEGYDGIAWGSLGGVKDVDQNTFIRPETSPGANNNELEFFTNDVRRLIIGDTQFTIEATNPVEILNTTESSSYTTGALTVAGGVGIAKNLHVQGYINGDNSGVLQLNRYATDKLLLKSNTIESAEELRIVTAAPDSSADGIVYPLTLIHQSEGGTVVAGAGTGIKFELETQNANYETTGSIDLVATDVTGSQEDFDMVFSTMIAGTAGVEKFRLGETVSTLTTDLAINNDTLSTDQATFNLLNTTATTVNFAGAATALNIGATGGLTTIDQNVQVNEDVTIDGTLALTNIDLEVQYGGTGVSTFTENGILYGDTANPVQVTDAAGTSDVSTSFQILTVTSDVDATPVWTDTIDGGSF